MDHPWCTKIPLILKPTFISINANLGNISDLMQEGQWNLDKINEVCNHLITDLITRVQFPPYPDEDKWVWRIGQTRMPLMKAAYNFLTTSYVPNNPWCGWKKLWMLHVALRVKTFGWKLLHRCLLTTSYLNGIGLCNSTTCLLCEKCHNSIDHIFYECKVTQKTWDCFLNDF